MAAGRQLAALTGLEIHDVVTGRGASEAFGRGQSLVEQGERNTEAVVGGLAAGDGLEDEIDRCAALDRLDGRRDVGEDAGLYRRAGGESQAFEHVEETDHRVRDRRWPD